jgi:hypothetical protein
MKNEQKAPPNLRDVNCCANCWHNDFSEWAGSVCQRFNDFSVEPGDICDDFTDITQELLDEKYPRSTPLQDVSAQRRHPDSLSGEQSE